MTAFFALLNTYAIFFYLAGVIFVLLGIKMLFDARRAGRTTLFTLEQEQASDRAFRAVLVMLAATGFIGAVAGINAFVGPAVPAATPDIVQPTVASFTPPVILPTSTPQPTETPVPPTPVAVVPTKAASQPTTVATVPAAQPTAAPKATVPVAPPTVAPPPTAAVIYPAPPLNTPPNGDSIGANNIRFSWGYNAAAGTYDVPETLPADQFYYVRVFFTSRSQNKDESVLVCTHGTSLDRKTGLDLTDYRGEAVDGNFKWNVTIVQSASEGDCTGGKFLPLSPASETHTFKLPS